MRIKRKYLNVIRDLADYSQDLYFDSTLSKYGFDEESYTHWLRSLHRLMRILSKNSPRDLIDVDRNDRV